MGKETTPPTPWHDDIAMLQEEKLGALVSSHAILREGVRRCETEPALFNGVN